MTNPQILAAFDSPVYYGGAPLRRAGVRPLRQLPLTPHYEYSAVSPFRPPATEMAVRDRFTVPAWGLGDTTPVATSTDPYQRQVATYGAVAKSAAATVSALLVQFGVVGGPMGALIGAGAAALIQVGQLIANAFEGCGQTCIIASNDANKFGDLLLQNLRAYTSSPVRYKSMQQAALLNFDTIWNGLVQACSDPSLGDAGKRCLSDRQSGACVWKSSPGGWSQDASGACTWTDFGAAGSGTFCWNYFSGMRDPIANDPCVVDDPPLSEGALDQVISGTAPMSTYLIWGGVALVAVLVLANL